MERLFIRLSNAHNLPRTLVLCVLVLALPTLGIGLHADDFVLAQTVKSDPLDAFSFMPGGAGTNELRERGVLSWASSHDLKLHLLRPVASLSHAVDFQLWPKAVWFMHLENALLYAALVWLAALTYAQLLGPGQPARLAAVFYAFSPAHALSLGWVSSRNTILSALLGLLTVLLFVRAKHLVATLCTHALALAAGEAALAILAPLLAYALIFGRKSRVVPHVVLCASYLFAYAELGYGAAHGGMYLNALQQPWAFAENLLMAVPLYLHSTLVIPNASLPMLLPSGAWLVVALTCCVLAAVAPWIVPVLRTNKQAQFFAWSALGSIVPLGTVAPQDRLTFLIGFGGCGLLAVCLTAHGLAPLRGRVPRALFHLHTSCALLAFVPLCFVCCSPAMGGGPSALNGALGDPTGRDVVLLNVPIESAVASLGAMRRQNDATLPRSVRALYVGGGSYEVHRADSHTLDLHVARAWFRSPLERIARDLREEPFAAGDVETTDAFTAQVLEVDARGAPKRVRFRFRAPLDDPRWMWLRFEGAHVLPWTPPPVDRTQALQAAGLLL